MRIAMIGTKGVPAYWGGIEKYIEEVGKRLVAKGHEVTVFGSRWFLKDFLENEFCGMRIKRIPTLNHQATDALTNGFLSAIQVSIGHYDIANFHGFASYLFLPLVKLFGKKTVITAHGVDSGWDNPKYNSFAQSILRYAFRMGVNRSDRVTTVAEHLKVVLNKRYAIKSDVFPCGLDKVTPSSSQIIKDKYGLQGLDYILFLGRIDPIKRIDWVLDLQGRIDKNIRIVIAGGTQNSDTEAYFQTLKKTAGDGNQILFTGPVQGLEKEELISNCRLFINPSQYEGLPITVIEAISHGRCCLVSGIAAHEEIIRNGRNGYLFPSNDKTSFTDIALNVLSQPAESLEITGQIAKNALHDQFDWDTTTQRYEDLCRSLCHEKK